jgi:SAM-dependent methyltransferase
VALDELHRRRALSFGTIAADYDRFRPEPPAAALDWLVPASASAVAEIGAGTGALTRHLVGRVPEVVAVEPDVRMRTVLGQRAPRATIREGLGEAIPLDDDSVDAVLAASSWHWVEQEKGFAEVARILRTGGVFGLLWTGPNRSIQWVAQLMAGGAEVDEEVIREQARARRRRHQPDVPDGAPFTAPEVRVFHEARLVTAEDLVGLWGTYSQTIILDEEERARVRRQVEDFVATRVEFEEGRVELPIGCVAWRAERT